MSWTIQLDAGPLIASLQLDDRAIRDGFEKAAQELSAMTYAHMVEEASKKLHSRREMFLDGLSYCKDGDAWVIRLDAKVRWIDDGQNPHSLLESLLSSPKAKTARDGSKFMVVPFSHSGGPTQTTASEQTLIAAVRGALRKQKIPYKKLERGANGQPKIGVLHNLKVATPAKTGHGPGQGHGPIGAPRQGLSGAPFLQGLQVHQRKNSKTGKVERALMTYRVASSKQEGNGMWQHPGNHPVHIFDEAVEWSAEQWAKEIAPALIDRVMGGL